MLLTFLKGFGIGSGLIVAIGAQNAFVLSQGVKKSHYILIPLICAVCDALLIFLGVSGMGTLKTAILTTLAVSLLNPHVYLDTVVLLGSVASRFQQPENLIFGAVAILASFTWFFSLSLGGKLLSPLFAKQSSWKVLNTLVGITMWAIAFSLLKGLLPPEK